jgi:hypothetical protein
MNAVEFIQKYGYKDAKSILDNLPKNTTHITNDARMFVNAKSPELIKEIKKQINSLVCVSDLKKFISSIELVNTYGSLSQAKEFLLSDYRTKSSPMAWSRLNNAVFDYELIYGEVI